MFRHILVYGLALGFLTAVLQIFQYRLIVLRHAEEWYIGLIALFFAALGIWAGLKISKRYNVPPDSPAPAPTPEAALSKFNITPREYEVLQLMAQGMSNQEIADKLFVSLNTVKTHAANVFSKLDAQRRTQAIQKAKLLGLLAEPAAPAKV